jgi:hypothetical protein
VVEALVQAGCNIFLKSANHDAPKDVAIRQNNGNILKLLIKPGEDGSLAEALDARYSDIDNEFNATIIDFFNEPDIIPYVREKSVKALLENPRLQHTNNKANISYRWIHLPSNNVSKSFAFNLYELTGSR